MYRKIKLRHLLRATHVHTSLKCVADIHLCVGGINSAGVITTGSTQKQRDTPSAQPYIDHHKLLKLCASTSNSLQK